jgi:hypothetical protein
VALSDLAYLFYYVIVRTLTLVVLPIGMIYLMLTLGVFFWIFLGVLSPATYLVARRIKTGRWTGKEVR